MKRDFGGSSLRTENQFVTVLVPIYSPVPILCLYCA
jgi:hypothetical protein